MTDTKLSTLLLNWYALNGRSLPWRFKGGAHPNPYVILVSEFMLQQTTVKTVIPYFHRFMEHFPTIQALASADIEEVYQLWQGLGYYTRARSLHATAQMIVNEFGGRFPEKRQDVLKLKGIGAYTVASFLALAFNQPETVIDGNVMRIIARLYHLTDSLDTIAEKIRLKAEELTSREHPADYASAIMDLGATVCTPKNPQCLLCPWAKYCQSKGAADVEQIPNRRKLEKKEKHGSVYLIYNSKGEILIRKRTEKGLLSGLYEFPWVDEGVLFPTAQDTENAVTHVFTHFKLTLQIYTFCTDTSPIADGIFIAPQNLNNYPFSTLMKKVIKKSLR
ncbi:MAG: A/G-specific adenine glycosylase [Alphaproteobacteria bacterium]|nr:A/G-specific adenine glycosylase [Alphaproteobacteria bacterium]